MARALTAHHAVRRTIILIATGRGTEAKTLGNACIAKLTGFDDAIAAADGAIGIGERVAPCGATAVTILTGQYLFVGTGSETRPCILQQIFGADYLIVAGRWAGVRQGRVTGLATFQDTVPTICRTVSIVVGITSARTAAICIGAGCDRLMRAFLSASGASQRIVGACLSVVTAGRTGPNPCSDRRVTFF